MRTLSKAYFLMYYWCYEISFKYDDDDVRRVSALLGVTTWHFVLVSTVSVLLSVFIGIDPITKGKWSVGITMFLLLGLNYLGYLRDKQVVRQKLAEKQQTGGPAWRVRVLAITMLAISFVIFVLSVEFSDRVRPVH